MLGASVERLFERYRRKGDAKALAAVFDRTAPELFRLAQHLVRDPLEAEDVLQETYVAAIDGAERWDRERPLVPWLTGILARQASMARRRARRSPEPQRLTERREPDPADLAVESEFSRELGAALDALPELYREVLRRHLLDGARPAEIARDLGRAPGTVRMQLHRGLEQLRRVLPAGFAAGAALSMLAPRGLPAVREAVLAHATSAAATAAVAGAAVPAVALATWKLAAWGALALFVAFAAAVAWSVRSGTVDQAPPAIGPRAEEQVRQDPERAEIELATPALREPSEITRSRPGKPRTFLIGRVLGPSESQMSDVLLRVRGVARYTWPEGLVAHASPQADGSFEIGLDMLLDYAATAGPLDELQLDADHSGYLPEEIRVDLAGVEVEDPPEAEPRFLIRVDFGLKPAILVRGLVRWPSDHPGAARVVALPVEDGRPAERQLDETPVAPDGSYLLRLSEGEEVEILAVASGLLPKSQRVFVANGRETLVPEISLQPGIRVEGRCRNGAERAPFKALGLFLAESSSSESTVVLVGGRMLRCLNGSWRADEVLCELDEEGRFAADGLSAGRYSLWPGGGPKHVLLSPVLFEVAKATREVALSSPLERVEFDLAAGYAGVRVIDIRSRPYRGAVRFQIGEFQSAAEASEEGEVVLALPTGNLVSFRVELNGLAPVLHEVVAPEPGERRVEEVRLTAECPRARAMLSLWDSEEGTLDTERITVTATTPPGGETVWGPSVVNLVVGTAELTDLPEGRLTLEAFAEGAYRHYQDLWLPARVELELSAGSFAPARVELRRGGRLRIQATDGGGRFLPANCHLRDLYGVEQAVRFLLRGPDEQGFTTGEELSDKGPSDVYPNLPGGVYEVELSMEGRETRVVPVRIEVGETTVLEVSLP